MLHGISRKKLSRLVGDAVSDTTGVAICSAARYIMPIFAAIHYCV